ncbi:Phage terminase-like protein, large subunit, contains N-terminal HTH domain [Microlunatus flavus]|uniref:Phage terminase-like protein, large subunit, contains N-terminal HTH domain n=1 Tax=Microlunatus flavus TaxID=1036181 RepID=A0A1H9LL77_9ACTN|nr:Phage terminase-like protein, large subunit, contains N-terminal HTH domain [Microlunatus flavus]
MEAFLGEFLLIPKGTNARQPFRLEPFQRTILRGLFPARGVRPWQALTAISRGNGKSSLAAAVALYCLLGDEVEAAQVLCVASDLRQAMIVFGGAARMVATSPELAARCKVYSDRITVPITGSEMFPLPANEGALQGFDPSFAVVDELAYVPPEVWESVTGATGKREQSLVWAISTPPLNDTSVMHRLVTQAKTDPRPDFAYAEWTSDPTHDVTCECCWRSANPALGRFLKIDGLRSVQRTMRESSFRRLRLGQFVATAEDQWLSPESWAACAHGRDIEPGSPVVLAFDGSRNGDATVLVAVSVEQVPHVAPVAVWSSDGKPEGWQVPMEEVEQTILDTCRRFKVTEVCADPYLWWGSLQRLARQGVPVAEFPQSAQRMTPATSGTFQAVVNGALTHDGNTMLTEHVMNARCIEDHRGTRLAKPGPSHHDARRIDLAVSMVMGWARATHYASQPVKRARAVSWRY